MNREMQIQRARTHLMESAATKQSIAEEHLDSILKAAQQIAAAFRTGNKLLLCGNGGSAADCQHMAAEFTNRLSKDLVRPALPAIALTTDSSFLTAFANDYDFSDVFTRLVEALGKPGDVLLGISTSGNSINIIRAVEAARKHAIGTIALMGEQGQLLEMVDTAIMVPSSNTQYIQESHLAIEHIICDLVEQTLYGTISQA